jgi:formiminotetrahydrofolate cyclodeaminase
VSVSGRSALLEANVGEFLDLLGSREPTPGGGSASALAGALAAALLAMVARLSERERGRIAVSAVGRAEDLRIELAGLVDEDAAAFEGVMEAYRLPKSSEEEKGARREAVEQALIKAAAVPLEVARRCVDVLREAQALTAAANPNAISDLGVSAALAEAGVVGAAMNVAINARGIRDGATAERLRGETSRLEEEARTLRARVIEAIRGQIEAPTRPA